MSIEKKRGALSDEEKLAIRAMCRDTTITEIARALNRNSEPIIKYIAAESLETREMGNISLERVALMYKLKTRAYYVDIQKQLTDEEVETFEENWIKYIEQFNNDITYSEELGVKEAIILQILINRTLSEKKEQLVEIQRITTLLNKELSVDETMQDAVKILNYENSLAAARSALAAYTGEYTKLLGNLKDINRDLKVTRDQRKQKVEDNKGTFASVLKKLEDEEFRRKTGENLEIMKVAKERAKLNLMEYHAYADGKVDIPFLTPEAVDKMNIPDKEEEKDE